MSSNSSLDIFFIAILPKEDRAKNLYHEFNNFRNGLYHDQVSLRFHKTFLIYQETILQLT